MSERDEEQALRAECERLRAENDALVAQARRAQESHETLRMTVQAAGVGLWSWDLGADEVVWEAPLSVIFGLPPGTTPKGRDGFFALVHPEDRDRVAAVVARGVERGSWEDEYRIVRPDGALRWLLATGRVVRNDGRGVVMGAVIDATERRHRDERSREAQKLEAVGQLTAGIAHNFNNMLMGVLPNIELAERDAPKSIAPLLQSARESAQRAADLVRQLMTYAGRNRPSARHVESLEPVVRRAVGLCRTTFDKGIALEEHYELPSRARARMDESQLEQALVNILINARDAVAGAVSPRVVVSLELVATGADELEGRHGEHVRVRVTDNGAGMDAPTRARIFEPFFTTKAPGSGTGLGLPTTQAIVHEHGGWVAYASSPQRGSTFSLYLPCSAAPPDVPRPAPSRPSGHGTETVLVVDDESSIRRIVALTLGGAGYTTVLAASGQEALDLLADAALASEIALVLLDLSMPGMSRQELRARLREAVPKARVIYFTGYAFDATEGDDAVLEKPVTEAVLLGTIRSVLDR